MFTIFSRSTQLSVLSIHSILTAFRHTGLVAGVAGLLLSAQAITATADKDEPTYRKNKRPFHPSPTALDRS